MRSPLRADDVILTSEAPLGEVAYLGSDVDWVLGQRLFAMRSDKRRLHGRFLYYALQTDPSRSDLHSRATGTTAQGVRQTELRRVRIPLPPLTEQRRIAGILGALDDKIELNRRLSEALEATARALFRSRFVAEAGTEADGWRACTIGDLAEIVGGSTPSTTEPRFWNGSHYWATPKDLAGLKTPVVLRTERMLTDAGIGQISSGLLPPGTVLMSSRAPIGYLAITEVPVAINQGFIAMKPRPGVSGLFLLLWAASSQDQILSRANGSTFLEISKSSFRPIEVLAPPADAMASFDRVVRPIHERVVANERQIGVLAAIRDALLPRLLSGELTP
ncbi:MAG: restriction endonuclease subunit S [Chloroflexi bacterium]|nr:restriction endonuclease subunit S [Chloroflexota bacterium]